jgi:uncharacterized membrane protein YphA (DoxX/SURF4 family)
VSKVVVHDELLPVIALTGVRVVLGLFWLSQFTWKPPPTFGCPDQGFCLWLDKEIQHPLSPLYAQVLQSVVRPNAIFFGWVTLIVETAIGLSLILGLLTRLGGLIGMLWSLNLLVGLVAVPGETAWYYISLVLLDFLYFGIGSAGQIALDQLLGWRNWWTGAG